jgi:dTMP kinase
MPSQVAFDLIGKRQGDKGDIHELDHSYLEKCRESALELCDRYGWNRIQCAPDNKLRTVQEINDELLRAVLETLKN